MEWIIRTLEEIKARDLYRELVELETPQGRLISVDGKKLINFSSNDYLGLAKEADPECFEKWGAGSGASRLICGNFKVHRELERRLAEVKKTEESLLFSTGYMANLGVISSLVGRGDLILSDSLNHASIIDGCRLSRADVKIYEHCRADHLEELLKKYRRDYRRCLIVTDSVFSMDGDIAPLDKLFELKEKYDAVLLIDDAHATGVVGWSSLELFGLEPDERTVIIGTLGKALGTFGAFACGTSLMREYLINRCRSFIYTTALPPSIACQTLKNLEKVPDRMERLSKLVKDFGKMLGVESRSAIFPFLVDSEEAAVLMSKALKERGFWVPAVRPPTVKQSRLRITVTANHTEEDLVSLSKVLTEIARSC